jgi:hypothetical protein
VLLHAWNSCTLLSVHCTFPTRVLPELWRCPAPPPPLCLITLPSEPRSSLITHLEQNTTLVFVSSGAAAWGDSALCSKNRSVTRFPFCKVCVIALYLQRSRTTVTAKWVWTGSKFATVATEFMDGPCRGNGLMSRPSEYGSCPERPRTCYHYMYRFKMALTMY